MGSSLRILGDYRARRDVFVPVLVCGGLIEMYECLPVDARKRLVRLHHFFGRGLGATEGIGDH
jgi:hypothetical protein